MRELVKETAAKPEFREAVRWFPDDGAIDYWIRRHFEYTPQKPFQILVNPLRALEEIRRYGYFQGYCTDTAMLAAAILQARGEPVQFEAIRTDAQQEGFQHVYARNTRTQMIFDPTVTHGTQYRYLNIMVLPV